jgi:hypothetical protein
LLSKFLTITSLQLSRELSLQLSLESWRDVMVRSGCNINLDVEEENYMDCP